MISQVSSPTPSSLWEVCNVQRTLVETTLQNIQLTDIKLFQDLDNRKVNTLNFIKIIYVVLFKGLLSMLQQVWIDWEIVFLPNLSKVLTTGMWLIIHTV